MKLLPDKGGLGVAGGLGAAALALLVYRLLSSMGGGSALGQGMNAPPSTFLYGGRLGIPLVGDSVDFLRSAFRFADDRYQWFGNVSAAFPFFQRSVVLAGNDGMKLFYDPTVVKRHDPYPSHFKRVMGGHILNMLDDPVFSERRKIIELAAGFHDAAALDSYIATADAVIRRHIAGWAHERHFKFVDAAHILFSDIGLAIFAGRDEPNLQLAKWKARLESQILLGAQAVPIPHPGTKFWNGWAAGNTMKAFWRDVFNAHLNGSAGVHYPWRHSAGVIAEKLKKGAVKVDSKDGLAVEQSHMSIALTVLVGNMFSDSIAAFHGRPETWRKLADEVQRVLGADASRPLTIADLSALRYTMHVVDETRRLFPGVAGMMGTLTRDVTFQGYHLKKGTTVIGNFYSTSHDPREYHAPWSFAPERFDAGEPTSGRKWAWTPHGALGGRHLCPGIDLATYLHMLTLARLAQAGCTWRLPSGQDLHQDLSLFNPEVKSGVAVTDFACTAMDALLKPTGSIVTR